MLDSQAVQTSPMFDASWIPNTLLGEWVMLKLPASLTPATSVSILPDAALAAAHHDPIQHIKLDALLPWNLWPLARTGALDTCVVRGSGGGEKLDLILSLPKKHPVAAEVKGLTFGPGGLLQLLTPATGHLTSRTLGPQELSLVLDPMAVAQRKNRSGLNQQGQDRGAGRFMGF